MKRLIIIGVAVIFLLITVFSIAQQIKSSQKQENTITARSGKDFVIKFDSNATTGYCWQLAKPLDESMVKLVNSEYFVNHKGLIGSPGKEVWVFKALKAGETVIYFKYARPWEKEVAPVKVEDFTIIIK